MVTCALIMLTWYVITQCAVQATMLQRQVENKATALVAASAALEKLKSGVYPLKNQKVTESNLPVEITCEKKGYGDLLYSAVVKAFVDAQELVCLKTVVLKT